MINNTTVENNYTTTGNISTVYPITFEGATDAGGLPLLKVVLADTENTSQELVYNVDYALSYDDVQDDNDESLNAPHLAGIVLLSAELATSGNSLSIIRNTPFVQPVDFQVGRIDPEQVERVADESVLRDQEIRNQMGKDEAIIADHESRITDAEEDIDTLDETLSGHLNNLDNPHNTSLQNLVDTEFTSLQAYQFMVYDGTKWVNANYSATYAWGGIIGDIADQADLQAALDTKVNKDGTSIMTAPLKFRAGSMRGAVGPYLNGVSFWKLDSQGNITNIANLTDSQFLPVTTNSIDLGRTANTWKDLYLGGKAYVATINNGADLSVPAKSGTLATMGDVELAARSGRMLTDQGKWYAKMYSATTVPTGAEYDGRNYADFSQVDQGNKPIIVIYEGQSGAWVQSEIITPPAEYDGYVPITSKIWDIVEQTGQQGGRVLWNHTSKEFTPEPRIISTNDIEVTGDSTVIMPLNPSGNQIVNKDYVDSHVPTGGYHPSLFAHEWDDKLRNDVQWLRADTFSWHQGSAYKAAYKHLRNDTYNWYSWENNGTTIYTKKAYPEVGEKVYSNSALTTEVGEITAVTDTLDITVEKITVNDVVYDSVTGSNIAPTTETIAGVTVQYIPAEDGHKIVTDFHESEVADVYTATGVAWYYIIDYGFKRFKLPRTKYGETGLRDTVGNYIPESLPNITGSAGSTDGWNNGQNFAYATGAFGRTNSVFGRRASNGENTNYRGFDFDASRVSSTYQNDAPVQQRATQMYLYFYVGEFTQTAIENTAGLNAELFNDKLDITTFNSDAVKYCSFNTSTRVQITSSNQTAAKNGWLIGRISFSGSNASASIYVNDITVSMGGYASGAWGTVSVQIPLKAGQTYKYSTDGTIQVNGVYFYPED